MEPLTPAVFHILLVLAEGERHGYGIMQQVAAETHSTFTMGPGTLYGTLKRMLGAGLVEECGERTDPRLNEQRRKYYRLTEAGRRAAHEEALRMKELLRNARRKSLVNHPKTNDSLR
jgi:DNA-binding PadR family transcriptional regulator